MEDARVIQSIKDKLKEIEEKEKVSIIMAVESGSRAWGFASPDSDYDVRFIYTRRLEDYVTLNPGRDVIEWQLDDVYDINGWDLKKTLQLLHNSNPTVFEWCASPIVYYENQLAGPLRELAGECFSPKRSLYHYVSMAGGNLEKYLSADEVKLKKYFYVLRPVLAAKWVMREKTAPPMLFQRLVESDLDPDLRPAVEELLEAKINSPEIGTGPRNEQLDEYIRSSLDQIWEAAAREETRKCGWDQLDAFFRKAVLG